MTTKREEWKVYELDAREVVDADGNRIAEAYGGANPEHAERVHNARRIAAVPDMEAALLALLPEKLNRAHDMDRHTEACWQSYEDTPCLPVCEQARAALRKAGRL